MIREWETLRLFKWNRTEFKDKFHKLLLKKGILHRRGRPYHPESQGSIESFNKYFKTQLRLRYLEHKDNPSFNFEICLQQIIQFYNFNRKYSSTNFTLSGVFNAQNPEILGKVNENVQ